MKEQNSITLREASVEWIAWARADVKTSTASRYEEVLHRHILPALGDRPLDELTTAELDAWIHFLRTEGRVDRTGPLSPKTVNCILSVLKLVLDYARERDYPVAPVHIHYARQRAATIRILTVDEQRHLETRIRRERSVMGLGVMISLYTGLRIGEVCGLRWGDFNWNAGILTISRTVSRIAASDSPEQRTRILIDSPKTESSQRSIPIPTFLMDMLYHHILPDDYYVLSKRTAPTEPRVYYTYYKRLLERNGLPEYNYHALRHTFATRCIEHGCDPRTLAEILGHADITTTLRRYVHPTMDLKRREIERMANACRNV